jgi:hypothetical protein
MRIWDIHPKRLCRNHLLAEHRELHAIWSILTRNKTGYSRHPETLRWKGRLKALYQRHESLVEEFGRRGYAHHTPLDRRLAGGKAVQTVFVDTPEGQLRRLRKKGCGCLWGP